ncbi:MAG TPA: STAS domain-containing protein [Solirubrobacteraceae bacterium]|jgi:anti-anti-sigma factor
MLQATAVPRPVARCVPGAPHFDCTLNTGGTRAAWIHVAGELDILTSPRLLQALREAELNARLVVVDLREVTFIDSSGVHVIVGASHDYEWGGVRLMVVPSRVVDRMFALCGVGGQLSTFELSPGEAVPGAAPRPVSAVS